MMKCRHSRRNYKCFEPKVFVWIQITRIVNSFGDYVQPISTNYPNLDYPFRLRILMVVKYQNALKYRMRIMRYSSILEMVKVVEMCTFEDPWIYC